LKYIPVSNKLFIATAVKGVFIVAAKRTPFGTYGGKLMNFSATDLCEVAARAALASGNIKPEWVDSIVIGNVFHVRHKRVHSIQRFYFRSNCR